MEIYTFKVVENGKRSTIISFSRNSARRSKQEYGKKAKTRIYKRKNRPWRFSDSEIFIQKAWLEE